MTRTLNKLSATAVQSAKFTGKARKLFDGGGLYLHVKETGKYWRMKYRYADKERLLSLGVYDTVSLAEARQGRDKARKLLAKNIDPSAKKRAENVKRACSQAQTVEIVAQEWVDTVHRHKVVKSHSDRNLRRFEMYVFPKIGKQAISELTPADVLGILRPIEDKGHVETAHRIKSLLGQVCRYAVVTGRAERDVTADLKDALRPPTVKHHASITEPKRIGALLRAIEGYDGSPSTRNALRIAPILFVRPGELRRAEWKDFDLKNAIWNYTPSKGGSPIQFPLSVQAIQILREQHELSRHSRLVFPSGRSLDRPMSNNTLSAALNRLDFGDEITPHGFRAMARTVLAERLNFPIEHIEMQLAHAVKDPNGRAYKPRHVLQAAKSDDAEMG